jgi:single-stranded DNA-specific DHH superfamily exonuclease
MLKEAEFKEIRALLDKAIRPLFFFDNDADGLCSFLLLYKYVKDGKGIALKNRNDSASFYLRKIDEYSPDMIFFLDSAKYDEEVLEKTKQEIVWIDHHQPFEHKKVKYFNPRKHDPGNNMPTAALCYLATKKNLWIGTLGAVADWSVPPFIEEFIEQYPDILEKSDPHPGKLMFETRLGELIKIVNFNLKGNPSEVKKAINTFTRIESPYEILDQTTSRGKFIYKRFARLNKEYEELLSQVKDTGEDILLFKYTEQRTSFSSELSNYLTYKYKDKKIIMVARVKGDEMKCSIRSHNINVPKIIDKALVECEGYGGGHEHSCGACIKVRDFDRFLEIFKENI